MTEMLYGSRFLSADLADLAESDAGPRYCDDTDVYDNVIEYTPRHLRVATLSRELQEALDAAFAPEPEPLPEPAPVSMPLPEPVPEPTRVAEAETVVEAALGYPIVPETVEYPSVLPASAAPEPVIPETIFREAEPEFEAEPEPEFVAEPEFVPEPEPEPEPVIVLPAPAARSSVPVPEHTPVSPTPFPERDALDERPAERSKKRPRRGRKVRPAKVDVSRLMVPSPQRIANG